MTDPKNAYRITFSSRPVYERLAAEAEQSGLSVGQLASRYLQRTFATLPADLRTVEFSEAEASLICDALKGTLFEAETMKYLPVEIEDAIRLNGLAEKWGVDGAALLAKLDALTPGQRAAVVSAAEDFWRAPDEEGRLRTVGLVR